MTKVYLVKGSSGSWEDSREWIECSYFDEKSAMDKVNKLNKDMIHKRNNNEELYESHVKQCDKQECKKCNKYFEIDYETQEQHLYRVQTIEVI